MLQSIDVSSENMRALPHEFARSFSDKELSCKMKIRTQWGRSWEVAISKNPRFYFMEKSGWEKFLRNNALGRSEFLTFTHKGNLCFTVNIFKQDGKEMLQPSQSRASLASSGQIETDQRRGSVNNDVKKEEVVSPELSNRCPTSAAESNGGRKYKRKLSFGKKKAEESKNSKRTKGRVSAEASSSSVAEFTVIIRKSYLNYLWIPSSVAKDHMPKKQTIFKIHHPNGRNTWNVVYLLGTSVLSGGWRHLSTEYPIAAGDTCKFTFIKPDELLLVVSKPQDM